MADILKIEKEISLIREDIESTEGRFALFEQPSWLQYFNHYVL
jgi:hypothetical protein